MSCPPRQRRDGGFARITPRALRLLPKSAWLDRCAFNGFRTRHRGPVAGRAAPFAAPDERRAARRSLAGRQ